MFEFQLCCVFGVSEPKVGFLLKYRAGLRVCPERNELRLKEAHFTAQAQCFMTLVHLWVTMFHVKFSEKSVGKVNPLRTSCMSAFSRFSLSWSCINPKWNPNRNMVDSSMGPGGFITCINPKWNPNGNKVTCSDGLMVAGSALGVCPPAKPLVLWVKYVDENLQRMRGLDFVCVNLADHTSQFEPDLTIQKLPSFVISFILPMVL